MAASTLIRLKASAGTVNLAPVARFPGLRALLWHEGYLYASRGYELLRNDVTGLRASASWQHVANYDPGLLRNCSSSLRLSARLLRDGFHALAIPPSGCIVAAAPGRIVTLNPGESEFHVSHRLLRGTRPLRITAAPNGNIVWGEYFDNRERGKVHIYASIDNGQHWDVAYTFPKRAIRHIHNIVYDQWEDCYWILTGDEGPECRLLRSSLEFRDVDPVLTGSQQARAAALIPTREALFFSTDTPFEANHIYRLDRSGNLAELATLSGSSIYGCGIGDALFFSTMVEPSAINREPNVCLYGSPNGTEWQRLLEWEKDAWPIGLFQYGNAFLPDGENNSSLLALTTIAVKGADLETSIWQVSHS